jgi:hypothetical protein
MPVSTRKGPHPFSKPLIILGGNRPPKPVDKPIDAKPQTESVVRKK